MNSIIKLLAMILAMTEIVVLFVALVGGLLYAILRLVWASVVLTVSMYHWWVKLLTEAKEVGRADHD